MAGTHFKGPLTVAGVEVISDAGAITADIQATAGSIGTAELAAGVLSADAAGRAKVATNFFDSATVGDKFEPGVVTANLLAGSIKGSQLGNPQSIGEGLQGTQYLYGFYDFAGQGGLQGAITDLSPDQIGDGYIVKNAYYLVETTCTSATDAATIALSIEGANDLVSAVAISAGGNVWDATGSWVQMIPDNTVGNFISPSTDRSLTMTIGVEDLTAGIISVILEVVSI